MESVERLHEVSIGDVICTAAERDWVGGGDLQTRLVMIFSAKRRCIRPSILFATTTLALRSSSSAGSVTRNVSRVDS